MAKYHINPHTGNPNKCTASAGRCPFGGDDVHHASAPEARAAYEAIMASPILVKAVAFRPQDATYYVEYDYDSYDCTGECYDSNDYCRDRTYEGLRLVGWETPNSLYDYVHATLSIPHNQALPADLKELIEPFRDGAFIRDELEIYGENDYYGEVARVEGGMGRLDEVLQDYHYGRPNAQDPGGLLPYLRGKGFATDGHLPLDALKESLKRENNGRVSAKVARADAWRMAAVPLSKIVKPQAAHAAEAAANPAPLTPVKGSGSNKAIAGVVFEVRPDVFELIDGYHRTATLEADPKRRTGNYIVLGNVPKRNFGLPSGWQHE